MQYRCSIPCDDWECFSNGPHTCDETQCPSETSKCKKYPTARCVPVKDNHKIVLKSEKKRKIIEE